VVTGDGRLHHYRLDDYDAYFRRVRRRFEERLLSAERVSTCPEPVEHCRICRWWQECADRRRDDDHLSRVAGVTRLQTGRPASVWPACLTDRTAPGPGPG
jgi:predicted RecB family nuclease